MKIHLFAAGAAALVCVSSCVQDSDYTAVDSGPSASFSAYDAPTSPYRSSSRFRYEQAPTYQRATSQPVQYGFGTPSITSSESPARSFTPRRTTYSSDYNVDQTLGGNTRVSDRWGNSSTFDHTLGGDLRSTSNTGQVTTYSQNLGGGYKATTSGGTTYQREQTLSGDYRVTGSDGSSYSRTQVLGGGYRYDRD
jgi:hypothetical protein